MFTNYSYERVGISDLNQAYEDPEMHPRNPFLRDALLLEQAGKQADDQQGVAELRLQHRRQPDLPVDRQALHAGFDLAGLGGNTSFYKPTLEGIWFFQHTSRTSIGGPRAVPVRGAVSRHRQRCRSSSGWCSAASTASAATTSAPSARATSRSTGLVIGGNKSLLFNGEYI